MICMWFLYSLSTNILDYTVQIYLVVKNHHLRISNPFDKMFVFLFLFC